MNDPENLAIAQLVKEQQSEAGIEVSIRSVDQPTLINEALAGTFTGMGFRQHPGGDPDTQYVWWHSGSPVNFGRINDPEIDALLDEGRVETDPAKRTKIYQDLTRAVREGVVHALELVHVLGGRVPERGQGCHRTAAARRWRQAVRALRRA